MDLELERRLQCPEFSTNSLADALSWLKMGDVVVLTTGNGDFVLPYHRPEVSDADPETYRVIYINIDKISSLGEASEWPWYFNSAAQAILSQDAKIRDMVCRDTAPHKVYCVL